VAQAFEAVVRRLEVLVRHQQHGDARFSSILVISVRFSFSRNEVTSTGTCTCTAAVLSFIDSS
jgi:hypothetical protein